MRLPVIPIPVTRLFKAVFTPRACTCELSTSLLCPIVRNRHKSTVILLCAWNVHSSVGSLCASRHRQTRISSRTKHIWTTQDCVPLIEPIAQWESAAKFKKTGKLTYRHRKFSTPHAEIYQWVLDHFCCDQIAFKQMSRISPLLFHNCVIISCMICT